MAVSTLQTTLSEIHLMLAALTSTPQIALSDEQAAKLAAALANVTRHMDLPALSPQKMALAMLFWTAGSIYVPMVLSIRAGATASPSTGHNGGPPMDDAVDQTSMPPSPWFTADGAILQ